MNIPVPLLLAACVRGLKESIRPELQTPEARAQLAAMIDLLSKLQRTLDWSDAIRADQEGALRQGLESVKAIAVAKGLTPPASASSAEQGMRELSDWIFESVPAGELRSELDRLAQSALRAAVAAERRHIPRTDFSSMTEPSQS